MSYKVLARKWRPQHFRDMLGQEPVLRALVNALDTNRLHHAYLFTGMRGVGKTTIARILAKCLNCETHGVTSSPCGECSACRDIEAGRFFDLIEVDAASRTKVDETRELLENVPYAPASGRYKVYLIDEVHMFSTHSFNALLKTLEEPPEHVKFLLATTDPQKVPVTVLSRCLQFNLKRMSPGVLTDYLSKILTQESIEHERPALDLIARASEGSVRDSLSLVEQAAAFGEGAVREQDVESMLGRASVDRLLGLIESLGNGDMIQLFERIEQLAEYAPDFAELLGELLSLMHRIALLQSVPGGVAENVPAYDRLLNLASSIAPDEVQLYYQIGLHARRDMPFAPDPREAFDMALLRMNAFKPQGDSSEMNSGQVGTLSSGKSTPSGNEAGRSGGVSNQNRSPHAASPQAAEQAVSEARNREASASNAGLASNAKSPSLPIRGEVSAGGALRAAALAAARGESVPAEFHAIPLHGESQSTADSGSPAAKPESSGVTATSPSTASNADPASARTPPPNRAAGNEPGKSTVSNVQSTSTLTQREVADPVDKKAITSSDWPRIVNELDISGMPRQLASNSVLHSFDAGHWTLNLETASEHLNTARFSERVRSALSVWLGTDVRLTIDLVDAELETPARLDEQRRESEMAAARVSIDQDPVVRQLIDKVDGSVDEASIQPLSES